jgi:predicted amidohydrolase YtcJ
MTCARAAIKGAHAMDKADLILTNGRVFCGLNEGFVESVAVAGGRVLATGKASDIAGLAGPATRSIDLGGRLAVPGLNDAHMHLLPYGLYMAEINLRPETGARSVNEILRRVAERAKSAKPGEWILGRGYDHNELAEKRHPTADELDRIAPNNPVYISAPAATLRSPIPAHCVRQASATTRRARMAG